MKAEQLREARAKLGEVAGVTAHAVRGVLDHLIESAERVEEAGYFVVPVVRDPPSRYRVFGAPGSEYRVCRECNVMWGQRHADSCQSKPRHGEPDDPQAGSPWPPTEPGVTKVTCGDDAPGVTFVAYDDDAGMAREVHAKVEELRQERDDLKEQLVGAREVIATQRSLHEKYERITQDAWVKTADILDKSDPAQAWTDRLRSLLAKLIEEREGHAETVALSRRLATKVNDLREALEQRTDGRNTQSRRLDDALEGKDEATRLYNAEVTKAKTLATNLAQALGDVAVWKDMTYAARRQVDEWNRAEVVRLSTALDVVTAEVNRADAQLRDADYDDDDGDGGTLGLGSRVANVLYDLDEARGQLKRREGYGADVVEPEAPPPVQVTTACPHGTPIADRCMACEGRG